MRPPLLKKDSNVTILGESSDDDERWASSVSSIQATNTEDSDAWQSNFRPPRRAQETKNAVKIDEKKKKDGVGEKKRFTKKIKKNKAGKAQSKPIEATPAARRLETRIKLPAKFQTSEGNETSRNSSSKGNYTFRSSKSNWTKLIDPSLSIQKKEKPIEKFNKPMMIRQPKRKISTDTPSIRSVSTEQQRRQQKSTKKQNVTKKNAVKEQASQLKTSKTTKKYICEYCDKSFNVERLLKTHLKLNCQKIPYVLQRKLNNVRVPQATMATKAPPIMPATKSAQSLKLPRKAAIRCQYCDKSFVLRSSLQTHLESYCDKISAQTRRMLLKPKAINVPSPKPAAKQPAKVVREALKQALKTTALSCKYCGRNFPIAASLNVHLATYCAKIPAVERRKLHIKNIGITSDVTTSLTSTKSMQPSKVTPSPYCCQYCRRCFKLARQLNLHQTSFCEKIPAIMQRKLKYKNTNMPTVPTVNVPSQKPPTRAPTKPSHFCKYCEKRFDLPLALTNHMKLVCEKVPPAVRRSLYRAKSITDLRQASNKKTERVAPKSARAQFKPTCHFCDKIFDMERTLQIHLLDKCDKIPASERRNLKFAVYEHTPLPPLPRFFNKKKSPRERTPRSAEGRKPNRFK